MLMAGVGAETCMAQSSDEQQETFTQSGGAQMTEVVVPSAAVPPPAPLDKTREQVMRELIEFQHSPQAAQMRELYRGN
jgi:hypothetical protein